VEEGLSDERGVYEKVDEGGDDAHNGRLNCAYVQEDG